jgi:hypothetical protein
MPRSLAFTNELFETPSIDPLGFDLQDISGRRRSQHRFASTGARPAQDLAEARDVHLHGVGCGSRRSFTPQLIDKPVERDRFRRVYEQQSQDQPLLRASEHERLTSMDDL